MFRLQGLIDFAQLGPVPAGELGIEAQDDVVAVTLPGLVLRWQRGAADVALVDGVLVLARGRARDGVGGASAEAARWAARYAQRGAQAAAEVGGGFAVAIVDFHQRRAVLFVDRFAIETLCYRTEGTTLAFSDSACDVPQGGRSVSSQALFDYLYFHVIPSPQTAFAGMYRLDAAHCLVAAAADVRVERYWKPHFDDRDRRDVGARKHAFVDIVRQSVADEADDAATACFLSGGTDSSTVAGMLTEVRGAPAHAYSIGFAASGYDEMEYARIAAKHFRLVHHEYYVTPDDLVRAIPAVAASFDQPFGNSSVLPAYFCALRAKEDGFTRMLAGDGGDELFAGNSRYATQKLFELYHALPRSLRTSVLEPAATGWRLFRDVPGFRQLGGYVRHSRVTMPARLETFNLLHRLGTDALLDPAFLASVDPGAPLAQQRAVWDDVDAASLVNRMLGYDWKFTLADSDLPKVRGAGELAGVGIGYPFLSRALTDFSLSVPSDWKLKGWKLRWFFKESLRDFLPDAILRKKKHGFGLPFGHWALAHAGLKDLLADALEGVSRRGLIRPRFADALLARHLAEAPGYYGEMAWVLMMLELWLRTHDATLTLNPINPLAAPDAASRAARTSW